MNHRAKALFDFAMAQPGGPHLEPRENVILSGGCRSRRHGSCCSPAQDDIVAELGECPYAALSANTTVLDHGEAEGMARWDLQVFTGQPAHWRSVSRKPPQAPQ